MHVNRFALLVLAILGFNSTCSAQFNRAGLSGTVTDVSGAVVAGATVVAIEDSTNTEFSTVTNASGIYNFVGLPVGMFRITCEHEGFQKLVRTNVVLQSTSEVRVDLQMTVGSLQNQIVVTAGTPLIEERTTTYGFALDEKSIQDIPLEVAGSKRTIYSLLAAVPGVTNAGFQNNVLGGVGFSSQIIIDGVGAEYNPGVPSVAQRPPSPEAVSEFKVINSTSAEYGLTAGGFISVVTKSGTDAFHGDAYEYLRNEAFDAKSFFATTRSTDRENEYGFTLGGPIIHKKTYFFGQYDGYRTSSATAGSILTLPTDAFKSGDFSALLGPVIGTDSLGRPVLAGQIYDPATTRPDGKGGLIRDPFPGNIIPQSRFSSVSQNLQSYFPELTSPNQIVNNYNGSSTVLTTTEPNYFIKISQVLGKGYLAGSYRFVNFFSGGGGILPSILANDVYNFGQTVHNVRLSYDVPITSRLSSSFTGGMDRQGGAGNTAYGAAATGGTTVGLTGVLAPCTPDTNIQGGYPALGDTLCSQLEGDTNWKLNNTFTLLAGKHTIKFGGSFYRWNANIRTQNNANGSFNFNSSETGLPGSLLGQTGFGYASFLLGEVDNGLIAAPYTKSLRSYYVGGFVQDEFRVTRNLTLNLGLRYDWQPQYTSPSYDASQFNPTIANPGADNVPGALEFLGFGTGRDGKKRFGDTYAKGFGPRVGLAYKLGDNTSVRASYGLYWSPVSQFSGEFANRQGFQASSTLLSPNGGVTSAFNWTSGYPPFNTNPTIDPTIANGTSTAFLGTGSAYPSDIQIITVSVQHQLPKQIVLEVGYIGNLAHHLATSHDQINQLDYSKYGYLGDLLNQPYDSPAAIAAGITAPFPNFAEVVGSANATVAQALRPYPQYQDVRGWNSKFGNAAYNALQVRLEKHFSAGLSFLVGYTLSKNLSDVGDSQGVFASGIQDAYNWRANRSVTDVDQRHAVVASYAYDLPLGPGKRFLSGDGIVDKYIAGGWTISGVNNYSTGLPLAIGTSLSLPTGTENLRPNGVPGVPARIGGGCSGFNPATGVYINRAAFADPAPFTFGNAAPWLDNVRGCANLNESISLLKSFPLYKERVSFQLGMDFFNVFNRHIFGAPDTNIDDVGFGQISSAGAGRQGQLHVKFIW